MLIDVGLAKVRDGTTSFNPYHRLNQALLQYTSYSTHTYRGGGQKEEDERASQRERENEREREREREDQRNVCHKDDSSGRKVKHR